MIFWHRFAAVSQHINVKRDCLAYVCQRFVSRLTLTYAARKARDFGHYVAIFSRIQENLSVHISHINTVTDLPLQYRQHNPRRILRRVINALSRFLKICVAALLVIQHELLRVARD